METRKIKTLIKSDHKLGKDDFISGRIVGAMAVLCKEDPAKGLEFGMIRCENGRIIMTETIDDRYDAFINVIENWYPGLCVFDYVE